MSNEIKNQLKGFIECSANKIVDSHNYLENLDGYDLHTAATKGANSLLPIVEILMDALDGITGGYSDELPGWELNAVIESYAERAKEAKAKIEGMITGGGI